MEIIAENYGHEDYSEEVYPNREMFLISKYLEINDLEASLKKQSDYSKKYCFLNNVLIFNEEYIN